MDIMKMKDKLYSSDAISSVPDMWDESVPFVYNDGSKRAVGFIYSVIKDNMEVKQFIAVFEEDLQITVMNPEELKKKFNLETLVVQKVKIDDVNAYLYDKEKYESLFDDFCSEENNNKDWKQLYELLNRVLGEEFVSKILSKIANNYIEDIKTLNMNNNTNQVLLKSTNKILCSN